MQGILRGGRLAQAQCFHFLTILTNLSDPFLPIVPSHSLLLRSGMFPRKICFGLQILGDSAASSKLHNYPLSGRACSYHKTRANARVAPESD